MRKKNKQAHDRNILCEKEQDRSFKVEEHKGGRQKQIGYKLIFHKGIDAVTGNQGRSNTQKYS